LFFVYVQVRIFLLLSAMLTRAISGRFGRRRAGFPPRTHRHRSSEEATLFYGEESVLDRERKSLP
jgi:hypothetical protein